MKRSSSYKKSIDMVRFIALTIAALLYADAGTDGKTIGQQYNAALGNKGGLNEKLFKPMTGGGNMTTLDGKKSFNATVQCASKEKAAALTFLPTSGGEWRVILTQDTNLNGVMDYTYDTAGKNISGYCGNGIISCSPGSWSGCTSYIWTSSGGKVSLQSVPNGSQALAGCRCSNSSCDPSSGLSTSLRDTIAGAVSATVMAEDPKTVFVKSLWDPAAMTYSFYAQSQTSCVGIGASGSTANLNSAWGSKNPPTLATTSSTLLSDENSAFTQANDVGLNPAKADLEAQAKSGISTSANQTFTVSENSTEYTYKDLDGSTKVIMNAQTGESCPTPACTVKRPKIDTIQFSDGTNRAQATGAETYEVFIKACSTSTMTPQCLLDTGEILVEDCTCSGSMNQTTNAIGTMKVMENVAKQYSCDTN